MENKNQRPINKKQDFFVNNIPQGEIVIPATRKGRRVSGREYPAGFLFPDRLEKYREILNV